nr:unnamed protein product [Digitaria exilis]
MGAGSSRADAPSRRRARLGLGGCFGAGSSSSSSAAAAAPDGGSFAAASSSRANEVQSRQSGRAVNALNFQASLATKDIQISNLGDDIFGELEESRYFHRRRHGSIRGVPVVPWGRLRSCLLKSLALPCLLVEADLVRQTVMRSFDS